MPYRYPIFMGDAPVYEVDLGTSNMHIRWRELHIVLPVEVMLDGMASAKAEICKWQLSRMGSGKVVQFPPR